MHRRCDRGIGRLSLNVTCFKKRSLHGCRPATIRQSGKHCSALSAIPHKEVRCSRISIIAYGNIKSSVSKLLFYFFFLPDCSATPLPRSRSGRHPATQSSFVFSSVPPYTLFSAGGVSSVIISCSGSCFILVKSMNAIGITIRRLTITAARNM